MSGAEHLGNNGKEDYIACYAKAGFNGSTHSIGESLRKRRSCLLCAFKGKVRRVWLIRPSENKTGCDRRSNMYDKKEQACFCGGKEPLLNYKPNKKNKS